MTTNWIVGMATAESAAAMLEPSVPADARAGAAGAGAARPVVLELYQSQGCSSCPPANAVLNEIAGRPYVLALSFAVTYWDRPGARDTFAQPAFTTRQWDYARAARRTNVATPQLIVNGRTAVLGSRRAELATAIAAEMRVGGPTITTSANAIIVSAAPAPKSSKVWLVAYDPRTLQVPIRAGENGGRTLPHRNIVRQLVSLGEWSGKAASYRLPATPAGLRRAVLVQTVNGGPIVAAAKL